MYLNGPRTLCNKQLSFLVVSETQPRPASFIPHLSHNYDILFCAAHFIGDGLALHRFANEFFTLLSSTTDSEQMFELLNIEVDKANAEIVSRLCCSERWLMMPGLTD